MVAAPHILVVDDDQEIRKLLARYLGEQGFRVSVAGSRREFSERVATEKLDLVILDVLLPDGSGLDLCKQLRQHQPHLPVILVTALKEDVDRIIGLELGADDYVGKPFNPRELLARVRSVLRRAGNPAAAPQPGRAVFRFTGFTADVMTRSVSDATGRAIDLTGAEFELLRVFLDRPGRILSRDQLLDLTQGREAGPFDRSIDVLVSRLRRKLGGANEEVLFKTVRNGGYQLAVRVERADA
ncbi:MAG: response regulator transcription factor [Devosia nanyangense]|uniref:Regulatory protein VirG n=1 Tax=Devosia nanyangense TaxID=1228055 RepID=A0A933L376_9HYPH|nr:response regulator transcription factor [Devosia nanyangense]